MAELVKIDPQSLGVGLYQHDVKDKELVSPKP
jgi:transcriptional accessory protein Tex/SPT6